MIGDDVMLRKKSIDSAAQAQSGVGLSKGIVLLMAISCGLTVANLYYNQPLLADIGRSFGVNVEQIGLISMLTQIGYAVGMFLFIPLGDIKERRKLITLLLLTVGVALIGMATAQNITWLYLASLAVGMTTVAPQMIVPLAAQLALPHERGKIIGNVMSGLLIGILLARTFSGLLGEFFGWRFVYGLAALMMFALAFILKRHLPQSKPDIKLSYFSLIKSLAKLIAQQRTLREAALIGAFMFGTFSVFWTSLTFFLEGPNYHYGSAITGLFGLVGVVGAGAASFVGRLADKVSPVRMVGLMILTAVLAYLTFWLMGSSIWGLIIGVILLDLGVQGAQVSNQARIYSMMPEARSRLNMVYMVSSFLGGALGSIASSYAWSHWGWTGTCAVGGGMAVIAFLLWGRYRVANRAGSPSLLTD